jgi:hypothetical protein
MATNRFVEITDREIREIKINWVPKNAKDLCKNNMNIKELTCKEYNRM